MKDFKQNQSASPFLVSLIYLTRKLLLPSHEDKESAGLVDDEAAMYVVACVALFENGGISLICFCLHGLALIFAKQPLLVHVMLIK